MGRLNIKDVEIGPGFKETLVLADGGEVQLRLVAETDGPAFVAGLELCSDRTIYNRFMGTKPRFSDSELRYLTRVDPDHHVAIVGFQTGKLVAVGRMVRYAHRADAADFGLIVADAWQGNGLGKHLLNRLTDAAKERGISYLCGEMFATNTAMFALVDGHPYYTDWILDGSTASFEIDLRSPKSG